MIESPNIRPTIFLDLDQSKGGNLLEINESVADGFMRVADMRADIKIIRQRGSRSQVYLDGRGWNVPINDDQLFIDAGNNKNEELSENEISLKLFRRNVIKQIDSCLVREKLFNDRGDSDITFGSYLVFAMVAAIPIANLLGALNHGNGLQAAGVSLALISIVNAGANMCNEIVTSRGFTINSDQPFIRHPLREKILPTVPVDRLIRGQLYLAMHGNRLLKLK